MAFPTFAPRRALADAGMRDVLPTNFRTHGPKARGREVAALLLGTAAVFLALALASYAGAPAAGLDGSVVQGEIPHGADWVGPVGESCARGVVTLLGWVAWVVPFEVLLLAIPFVTGKPNAATPARLAGDVLLVVIAAALIQVGWPTQLAFGRHNAAGLVGELFGELGRSLFSTIGSFLVGFACLGLILIARASFSFILLVRAIGRWSAKGALGTAAGAKTVADAWKTARELEREKDQAAREANLPHIDLETNRDDAIVLAVGNAPDSEPAPNDDLAMFLAGPDQTDPTPDTVAVVPPPPVARKRTRRRKEDATPAESAEATEVEAVEAAALPAVEPVEASATADLETLTELETEKPKRAKKLPKEPTIVDTSAALEKEEPAPEPSALIKTILAPTAAAAFRLPSIDFLVATKVDPTLSVDKETLYQNAELLVKTLADYGVNGKVEDILPGPTVTTYEVSPAAGTKVSKVASLADDLALALARKVRIVAPIPGKNRIGFELPNARRVPVSLRDLVEDRRFQTMDVPLPVVLGRDILGNPFYADLASMPHVIVAGATGAGKSVGLNVMLTSLLYRRSPAELRMLMIDPKVVELAPFDGIPHMLLPVVTDMKQAATALKWAVDEMERRYQLFADAGTKNLGTYNNWVERVIRGDIKNPAAKVVMSKDFNGFTDAIRPGEGEEGVAPLPEKLPLIVIVVDEFADLMMQQGKEVEVAVARLAQKARAAGMHVILATQRPSVDVITGMIKANFPTRIAYRVAQKVDSRTILDEQGAEHLLGRGDMLIKLNGTNETRRVQCPWVSEEEVQLVTDFLRTQGTPVYDENILKPRDEDEEATPDDDGEQDAMYDQALQLVADTRRCSTSWLQRKLGLGYNRAARLVETMERRGLVGPANGAKDREVLIEAR
jgi:S-DNA-T family DNA segregation ATPase FtsK/SpoIIIE